jgi:Transglycosylase SLT domain
MGWMDDPEIPAAKPAKRTPVDIRSIAAEEGASSPAQAVAASIYQQESSGGKNTKTSNAGAVGGMQMTPATFQRFAKPGEDINNPEHNARAAVRYIKHLDEKSGGDPSLIAAGYYSGEGGMEKARRGIAVRDPRNPDAPDSIQYARDVIARANASKPVAGGWMQDPEIEMPAPAGKSAGPSNTRGAGFVDPRMVGSKTEREQVTAPAERKAYEAGRQTDARRGLINALQGPTMGFADEIIGAGGGVLNALKGGSYKEGYREARQFARGADDQASADNPIFSTATQLAASAPTAVLGYGAGLVKGAGVGANALRAGITGGVQGAIGGAGRSTAQTAEGVTTDAATGGAIGAALGGVTAPIAAAVGAVGRNVAQRVSGKAATVGAQEKIAEALLRDARPSLSAESAIGQAGARINKLGPRATVADSAGENTRQLLDTLATLPGQTKNNAAQVIRDRQVSRAGVMIDAADKGLGAGGRRLAGTVQDLADQRATAAAPLYQQLHAQQIAPTDNLQSIIQAADELGASKLARTIATAERAPFTLGDAPGPIAFRDLDRLKQGLDTMIGRETDLAGKVSPTGNAVMKLKQAMLQELDSATVDPATGASLYKAARDAYSGPSAMMSAAETGRKLISSNEAGIQQALRGMSASELDAARVGMFEGLRQKLGNSKAGRTEIMGAYENPAIADKLKALFPTQRAYREFAATAAGEARLKSLESVGKGSQTAARQYGAGDLDMGAIGALGKAGGAAATGQIGSVVNALSEGWNRVKLPEAVRDEMGRLLLTQGAQGRQAINSLAGTAKQVADQRARNALITGSLAGRAGSAAASFGQ